MKVVITLLAAASLISAAYSADYFQDFEGSVGSEWSSTTTSAFNGTTVLGRYANDTVKLTLSGFTAGQTVKVGFDLYILDSWDGNTGGVGPDYFNFSVDGATQLNTTFANVSFYQQSYPVRDLTGSYAAQTGADNVDISKGGTLPDGFYGNSLYKFGGSINAGFEVVATGSTMEFSWQGSNLQGVSDESWALDNVKVQAVPEPGSICAMGLGLAALLRKRRKSN